jgi:uncharacterized protein (TIGR02996 family)
MFEGLLHAVREDLDDPAPRLILADWLEEHGDEADRDRAEFIRIQCQLDELPEYDARTAALQQREAELRERRRAAWEGSLEGDWIRGFYHVGLGSEQEFDNFLATPALWPWVGYLTIRGANWDGWVARLLQSESLRWVHGLSLSIPCYDRDAALLAGSPHLGDLVSLYLSTPRFGPDGWRVLLTSPRLARLRSFGLAVYDKPSGWLAALPDTSLPPTLIRLSLAHTQLGDAGAETVSSARPLARVRHLDLRDNGLTAAGARALAASLHLHRPLNLIVRDNPIGDDGLRALLDAGLLPGASLFDLYKVGLGAEGAAALAECPRCAEVRDLCLSFNQLPTSGAIALANSPHLAGLTTLDLTYNRVGDEGANALARAPHLRALERLELMHNGITRLGAVALARGELPALSMLELAGNPLGAEGVRDFHAELSLPALRHLDLSGTNLGDEGVAVVAGSPALGQLRVLVLKDNRITDKGAEVLADSPHLDGLEHLTIWGNRLSLKGKQALRDRLGTRVDLGDR